MIYERFFKICRSITETLKVNPQIFNWASEQNKAFEELKKRLITAPIQCHCSPDQEMIVEIYANDFGLGCFFSQF